MTEAAPLPEDIPVTRPPWLGALDALVGEWEVEARLPADPPVTGLGLTTFEWLPGRFFVLQRFASDEPAAPDGVAIIGAAADGRFTQRYFDSRGVHRVYSMSLRDGIWRIWRDAPGFWQRYRGALDLQRATITGAWERSTDGLAWEHDFDLSYRRIG
jgi:hypothetical protein